MFREDHGSDVYFKEDVRCMLQAILATNEELARQFPDPQVQTYRHGFSAAIAAVAVAFNINLEPQVRPGSRVTERVYSHQP